MQTPFELFLIVVASLIAIVLTVWVALLFVYRRPLLAYWDEPIFKVPILIFESDDWGPAPPEHGKALSEIASLLADYRDRHDRHPMMTLGIVLAVPKRQATNQAQFEELTLHDPSFAGIVKVLQTGVREGFFQLQLHGRSHFWPDALIAAANSDPLVSDWLAGNYTWHTEALPDGLQSRWAPEFAGKAMAIDPTSTRTSAEQESRLFLEVFGIQAVIAVPPTFVWNSSVEQGWHTGGIRGIVTPGRYFTHRKQFIRPALVQTITNGMRSNSMIYVVRDRYFEPAKGHSANDGLRALQTNTALARPTLLETHRYNFIEPKMRARALSTMRELLTLALATYKDLRFLSTNELIDIMANRSPNFIERSVRYRLVGWCARAKTLSGFWRLARLSGLAYFIAGVQRMARPA